MVLLLVLTILAVQSTPFLWAPPSSDSGVKLGEIIAVISVLVNVLMAVFTFLFSRKASAEERLRKAEQDRAAEALSALKGVFESTITQLRSDIATMQHLIDDAADVDVVNEIRADFKDLRKAVAELEVKLFSHHGVCSGKFVDRAIYEANNSALRETIKMIHEMIKQQAAIIEKLRS